MDAFESRPPRVLLVDDTPANLLALTAVLRPVGAELVEARSGQEALDLVLRNWFAVILIDVQMPGMDGFETAARIRATERGREVPILFLTAIHAGRAQHRKGYDAGAADYITKPFDARSCGLASRRSSTCFGSARASDASDSRPRSTSLPRSSRSCACPATCASSRT